MYQKNKQQVKHGNPNQEDRYPTRQQNKGQEQEDLQWWLVALMWEVTQIDQLLLIHQKYPRTSIKTKQKKIVIC